MIDWDEEARGVLQGLRQRPHPGSHAWDEARDAIATALRTAVERERERCARVCLARADIAYAACRKAEAEGRSAVADAIAADEALHCADAILPGIGLPTTEGEDT